MHINIVAGWLARGLVIFLAFINTRLLIESVGIEGLAVHSIITSLIPWITLLNLGLPTSIQHAISISRGRDGGYDTLIDHSFGTMIVMGFVLLPVTGFFAYLIHYFLLTKYPFVAFGTVLGTCVLIHLIGVCQLLTQVMYAEHEAFWPNIYPAFAPVWTSGVLLIAVFYKIENFNFIMLAIAASNMIMPMHAARRMRIFSKAKFNFQVMQKQIINSRNHFIFAIMAASTLSIDYAVMSRTLTHLDIVEYNLVSRLFLSLMVVHSVVLATSWTPISDLMNAGKKSEARTLLEKVLWFGILIATVAGFLIILLINPLSNLLTGGTVNSIPIDLCIAFYIYIVLRIWTDTFTMAIQGYGMVSDINRFLPIQAFISILCQYYLGHKFGATGIVYGLILSFLLTAAWIIPKKFYSITRL
jgi:O-antigen/teichoic acid export membrane protein